ncbi:MAG: ribokinase [Alphaproteobacteria bacterium]|nr:ribokinase [Alphaproteobacteria bacterium]
MTAKLFILGSYITDLMMRTPRLPKRGETIFAGPFQVGPGGKGSNQAVAARRAGAEVTFATRVGDDDLGRSALAMFKAEGIDARFAITDRNGVSTGAALIMVEEGSAENMITVAIAACAHFTDAEVDAATARLTGYDVAIFQLETNLPATLRAIDRAHAAGVKVLLNPAPVQALPEAIYPKLAFATPNETEAATLTGIATDTDEGIKRAAAALLAKGIGAVIMTLGAKGAFVKTREVEMLVPVAPGIKPIDTTGAGDSFAGCFACAIAEGKPLLEAVRFANAGAGLSTTRIGTAPAMAQRAEIDALLARWR